MGKGSKLLRKIATGQFAELGSRASEELVRRQERRHYLRDGDCFGAKIPAGVFDSEFVGKHLQPDQSLDLAEALRNKPAERFFPGFDRAQEFGNFVAKYCPQERERIIKTANQILNNEIPIFNSGSVKLDDPPNWNQDVRTKTVAPERFYGDIDYLDPEAVGDSKVIWEPSRLQFVFDLGQAYVLTGDERYAAHFFDLLNHWNRRNRDYHGINFCSALEFAFRANSVIWGLYFFQQSRSLNQQAARDIYRILYISGRFMANHLSRYFSPNTHLLGEAYGLYLIGQVFPEFARSNQWRTTGRRVLLEELKRQFHSDGLHAELSICYHAYCVEFVLSLLILAQRSQDKVDGDATGTLREMANALRLIQSPSGMWPHFGDEDGGRLYFLSRPFAHDFGPILQAAQQHLGFEISPSERAPESFWLNGTSTKGAVAEAPQNHALAVLRGSGIVVSRSGTLFGAFLAGPFGYQDCPHSHADALHIDLSVRGEPLVIDPGTCCYTGVLEARNLLRGSASHNGPRLLGREYYDPEDPFGWLAKPNCQIVDCHASSYGSYYSAKYRLRFPDGVESEFDRRVLQINDHGWMIQDRVQNSRPHQVAWDFVTPGVLEQHGSFVAMVGANNHLRIRNHPTLPEGIFGETIVSSDYGSSESGRSLRLVSAPVKELTETFTITAHPHLERGLAGKQEFAAFGHLEYFEGGLITYIESRMEKEDSPIATDAEFGMAVCYDDDEAHILLCLASNLRVGDQVVFESDRPISFVDIQIREGKARIEAPANSRIVPLKGNAREIVEFSTVVRVDHVRNLRNKL